MSATETRIPFANYSHMAPAQPVGRVTLTTERTFRDASYETAAWFQEVTVPAGTTATLWHNGNGGLRFTVEGIVTDAYFGSLYGGVAIGKYDKARDTGKPGTYVGTLPLSAAAEGEEGYEVTLAPEYDVESEERDLDTTGRTYTKWTMTMPESGHPLVVERERGAAFAAEHTYRVTWRGEDRGTVTVGEREGFNGDTSRVAMKRALEMLKG